LTLEDLGNLGDFIGGIAVVATLIYLAVQIRQNTQQLRRSAEIAAVEAADKTFASFSQFRQQITADGQLAELYLKGLRDHDSLTPIERFRFDLLLEDLFYMYQTSSHRMRTIRDEDFDEAFTQLNLRRMLRQPSIRIWWEANKGSMDRAFVAEVDARIERESPAPG